jgi:predicted enzyme related to lactoylglutathione lyase
VKISHVHCQVRGLPAAVTWFRETADLSPSFASERMAVFKFGAFTLILDAGAADSVVTVGFDSADCDADFAAIVSRGAQVLEPPQDRPYGARVAYLQGPGAMKIELEQVTKPRD